LNHAEFPPVAADSLGQRASDFTGKPQGGCKKTNFHQSTTTMKTYHRTICVAAAALLMAILPSGCNREAKAAGHLKAAHKHFEQGDYAAAEIRFKNALEDQPGQPDALKGLGLVWVRQGVMLEAGRILTTAKSKLPADDEIGYNLALAMLNLGFLGDSRKELIEVLDRTPDHGDALMLLAETSLTPDAMNECGQRIALAKSPDKASVLLATALIELRRGKSKTGADAVAKALEIDPKFARAHALQSSIFRDQKQPEKALESLKTASDLGGPRSPERGAYAKFLMSLKRQDDALALLKEATETAPDYLPNWNLLGRIAFGSGNDSEATAHLAKVLAKCPLDLDAAVLQSQIWLRGKEPAKAVELLEELSKTFPKRAALELALGKAYLATDSFAKAADMLDRVLKSTPGATEAVLLRANLFLKDGQPAEAIQILEPLNAASPENRAAEDLLATAYRHANRENDAIAILKRQAVALPNEPKPQFELGQLLASQGKLAEARAVFERMLALVPDQIAAVGQLIAIDQREGNADAAMARIDAYLGTHPQSPQAHLLKAGLCYARKDYKTAEAFATKAIELKPDDTMAYGMLVRIQTDSGRSEEAIGRLKELIEASPKNVAALMHLGTLYQSLGRNAEARTCNEELVKLTPNFAPAYNNLAYFDSLTPGKLDQALQNALKARELAPDEPSISDTCGWIEWLRGDYRQALSLLRVAANRLPEAASVQYHLAMTHYMLHQTPEAISLLEKALALSGEFPEKDQATIHLATLRDGDKLDLATLEQRLKDSPKDPVLALLKARKLASGGRPEDALAAYQNALETNPDLDTAHLGMADLYAGALQQPEKALESANQARKIAPQSARAAAVLGGLEFRRGKHQEAYSLLQEAALKLPADASVQVDYAWAAFSIGRADDARAAMAKLTPSDPAQASEAKDFLALTDPNATTDPATPERVEKKLAANPNYLPALMVRAALQEKAGENPADDYKKLLALYPQFDPARIALARIFLDDPKQLEAAEKLANAARERLANDPELSGILALINFRKGQFEYAAQLLKELSTKRPLNGRELFALGMSQAATKRPDEARKSLNQALQTKLPDADASQAKATLAELDKQMGKGK
jgi:tetratricopeptide (TPR) repeat protein